MSAVPHDRLLLISAWNDSGGGFTHRLFDGHPQVKSWPFELQLGTRARADGYSGAFHDKYRWPFFPSLNLSANLLFDAILDDELKPVLRGDVNAKHESFTVAVKLDDWCAGFARALPRLVTRANLIRAYMESFFELWGARKTSGREIAMLGHCPCLALDSDEIVADFPDAHILHVMRDPRAGLADFRRRHPQMPADRYAARWNAVNAAAAHAASKYPERVSVMWFASLLEDRAGALTWASARMGLNFDPCLLVPSWNGEALAEEAMGPFGGVPQVGLARESAAIASLPPADALAVDRLCAGVRELAQAVIAKGHGR